MGVFFVFSDESGVYRRITSERVLQRVPFYCRCGLLIGVDDWISLRKKFSALKASHSIPKESEIKWEFLWLAKTNMEEFKKRNPDLQHLTFRRLLSFVTKCLEEMSNCSSCKLVFTVTVNALVGASEERVWRMHLEDIMQRVEMQIGSGRDNLAVIFLDSVSKSSENVLRERYSELLRDGVFLEYRHIKDSIAFEYSHHSYAM